MSVSDLTRALLGQACDKLTQHLGQIVRCTRLLTDEEVWYRSNDNCNSIGNLLLHLTGNIRQWVLGGLGGENIERNRPAEFAARGPQPAVEVLGRLVETVDRAIEILGQLDSAELLARRTIQDYDVTGVIAVCHVVEHFAFHTGQIVHITKMLKDVDVSVYDALGHKRPGFGQTP
jgi:uncharacterized damage-inducible protein DinB